MLKTLHRKCFLFAIIILMKSTKSEALKSRRRFYIRLAGVMMLTAGFVLLGVSLLLSTVSMGLFLLAAVLIVTGLILTASPEAFVIVIESISWIP